MGGWEAFEAIRRLHPSQDLLGRKLAGFIQKPYTRHVFREKPQEALNRA